MALGILNTMVLHVFALQWLNISGMRLIFLPPWLHLTSFCTHDAEVLTAHSVHNIQVIPSQFIRSTYHWKHSKLKVILPQVTFLLDSSNDQDTTHAEKGCAEFETHKFHMAALMFLTGHGIKARKPCLCRNHTFSNSVHHQNLESTQTVASCFPDPDGHWCISLGNVWFPHSHGFLL